MAINSIFITLLAISVFLYVAVAFLTWHRRKMACSMPFMLMVAGAFVWGGAYILEIRANTLDAKIFWDNIQFSGTDILAGGLLVFALVYAGRAKTYKRYWYLLLIEPLITLLLVWLTPQSDLLRIDPRLELSGIFPILTYKYSPVMWTLLAYVYALALISMIVLVMQFYRQHTIYRRQTAVLLLGAAVPLAGSALTVFGWVPVKNMPNLDITPITMSVTCLLWASGLFYFRILDIMPVARQIVLDEMQDALFVLDGEWRVLDINRSAERCFDIKSGDILGHPLTQFFPDLSFFLTNASQDEKSNDFEWVMQEETHTFSGNLIPLFDHRQVLGGWILTLMDISAVRRAEEEARLSREVSETLRQAGATLSATLDFDQVLDRLLELVDRVIPYDSGCVALINGSTIRVYRTRGYDKIGDKLSNSISEFKFELNTFRNFSEMYDTKNALVIPNPGQYEGWVDDDLSGHIGSWVGAPMVYQGRVLGFFALEKFDLGFYTPKHAENLSIFAGHAAMAMENARLYTEMRIDLQREQRLNEAMRNINRTMDIETILREILQLSLELVQADQANLGLITPDGRFLRFDYVLNADGKVEADEELIPRGETLSWKLLESAEPVMINQASEIRQLTLGHHPAGIQSLIGMPLQVGNSRLGVLGLYNYTPEKKFSERDLALVASIGHQGGIAIQNSRLFKDVQRLAITDPLTGWNNRRHFFSKAQNELERSLRYGHSLSVIMLDIDNFKEVNDQYGHLVGDQILQAIAKRINNNLRTPDVGGRYGGEEFVILLPETGILAAQQAAERIRITVTDMPIATTKGPVAVSISLGVAGIQGVRTLKIEKLLDMADQALYAAKGAGRNRVAVWRESGIHEILPIVIP